MKAVDHKRTWDIVKQRLDLDLIRSKKKKKGTWITEERNCDQFRTTWILKIQEKSTLHVYMTKPSFTYQGTNFI